MINEISYYTKLKLKIYDRQSQFSLMLIDIIFLKKLCTKRFEFRPIKEKTRAFYHCASNSHFNN